MLKTPFFVPHVSNFRKSTTLLLGKSFQLFRDGYLGGIRSIPSHKIFSNLGGQLQLDWRKVSQGAFHYMGWVIFMLGSSSISVFFQNKIESMQIFRTFGMGRKVLRFDRVRLRARAWRRTSNNVLFRGRGITWRSHGTTRRTLGVGDLGNCSSNRSLLFVVLVPRGCRHGGNASSRHIGAGIAHGEFQWWSNGGQCLGEQFLVIFIRWRIECCGYCIVVGILCLSRRPESRNGTYALPKGTFGSGRTILLSNVPCTLVSTPATR